MQQALTSRVVDHFLELCALPSPSGRERAVADRVTAYLTALGLDWDEDDAGARLDGDTGNVYCRIPPTTSGVSESSVNDARPCVVDPPAGTASRSVNTATAALRMASLLLSQIKAQRGCAETPRKGVN